MATPTRSEAASPTTAAPGSRSRSRPAVARASLFSASRSRPRAAPPTPSLRSYVDYSKHDLKKMRKLRLVPEEEWFPHQRHERHLTGHRFWTVVQKDLYLALKKPASDMRWINWASVHQTTGTDVRQYFAATLGLDTLLQRRDLDWAESHIRQFYATLWIHPDRSRIRFMFGNEQRELSRDDFAKSLGLSDSGARVHSLAYPNGNRDEVHLPPLESIRHLYDNPDAVMEHWKDHNQLNHETAVVQAVMRISIRPRSGESLTTLEIWILHLLMSAKPIDVVDLMIEEMQEIILNIMQRRLPYAPYLIHLFNKKGWLKDGMKNMLDQHLKLYKAPKPNDKRRHKNRALQPVESCKALKPDGMRRVGSVAFPPQEEAVFDDDEHAHFDRMLSPSLEERALVVATNEEDDPHMLPALVPDEFRFSQQGVHDVEAGGSGCHADVPPMPQSQVDRQIAILEQIQCQHVHDCEQILGQLVEHQRQSESDRQQILGQLAELQQQHELDRQQLQEQHERDRQQILGQLAEVQGRLTEVQGQLTEVQGQLTEVQQQHERDRQENRDLRNLSLVSLSQNIHQSSHNSDILALLDKSFSAICRLGDQAPLPPV